MKWLWEWRCCDHLWELIPSRQFPQRNGFSVTCPTCRRDVERKWVRL